MQVRRRKKKEEEEEKKKEEGRRRMKIHGAQCPKKIRPHPRKKSICACTQKLPVPWVMLQLWPKVKNLPCCNFLTYVLLNVKKFPWNG